MEDYALGQSLLIQPETPFDHIANTLMELGWQRSQDKANSPLLANEPEYSSWTWRGQKPILIYSFNPLVKLRVLDVATLPPALRGQLASHLPLLQETDVNDLLFDPEPTQRMLALWAMQETERVDLSPQAHRLCHDTNRQVAEIAKQVEARLEKMQESRDALMLTLTQLAQVAEPVIAELNNPAATAHLKPTHDDLCQLFDPALADAMAREVELAYETAPIANPGMDYPHLKVTAVNAGLLRWPNEFSRQFPQGYRNIAGWMQPQWIWLAWRWCKSDAPEDKSPEGKNEENHHAAVAFDGLVWMKTRWIWLPKAYRLVSHALQTAHRPPTLH
ncbi:hypothetical protein [Marinibactrum halimedae]|uniref:Uncharacterized protein n=1 Tax=Marinibactrum halimedae TaxID=1444977 RepID=A0AA37WQX2_9GAMM|nr:hypothetical protein [Marinibactrum halimedae]MCD9460616.1 hypothetical protein [Marinibactrum halimedae]GLS27832.1 hypothetical protein GCM10007877_35510 [Marinibactrum halimedae]